MSTSAIEHYLFMRPHWVPGSEIAMMFKVDERTLRARRGEPGLVSSYAISGNDGFKHVRHATDAEFNTFRERLRSHGLAELHRVSQLESARDAHLSQTPPTPALEPKFDNTGQGQLLSP